MAFLEFVRNQVTESGANTYTEDEVQMPTSRTERLAMLIWSIQMEISFPDIEDAQGNRVDSHLADSEATARQRYHNTGVLFAGAWETSAGAAAGTLSEYMFNEKTGPLYVRFDPPVLYAKSTIFHGIVGIGNSSVKTAQVMIGYTLEKVSTEAFIAALTE